MIQHNTSSLLSLAATGIRGPGDLPGHTYGGFGGPLEQPLVSKLAECGGGDPDDVRTAEVGDVDYRVGLERHQYDFVWIFDAWDKIRLEQDGVDVATIPFIEHTDCIPDWYTPMLATTEKELDQRPEVLERFMRATRRGYQGAMADPAAAAGAPIDAVPEVDADLVRASAYLATRYSEDPAEWGWQDARCGPGSPRSSGRPAWSTRRWTSTPPSPTTCCDRRPDRPGRARAQLRGGRRRCGPWTCPWSPAPSSASSDRAGAGRAPLLRVLAGVLAPSAGQATIDEVDVRGRPGAAAYMAQKDLLLPRRRALDNAILGSELDGADRSAARARRRPPGSSGSASPGSRRHGRTSSAAGCANGLASANLPVPARRPAPRRALRCAGRDHPTGHGHLAGRGGRPPDRPARHPRRGGGALLSDRAEVMSARPGTIVASIPVDLNRPRPAELVTDPAFVALRAQVLPRCGAGHAAQPDRSPLAH